MAAAAPSCCLEESRDPRLADARVSLALDSVRATLGAVSVPSPLPSFLPSSPIAAAPPHPAPLVLRV